MKSQRSISSKLQHKVKEGLIRISKKISNDTRVISMFLCDKGIAIPQSLAIFWPLSKCLSFFWPHFSTFWLFIETVIWQPCLLALQHRNFRTKQISQMFRKTAEISKKPVLIHKAQLILYKKNSYTKYFKVEDQRKSQIWAQRRLW